MAGYFFVHEDEWKDTEGDPQPKRNRRNIYLGCFVCCLLFFVLFGLLAYFFYPRIPTAVINKEQITIKEWGFNSTTVKLDLLIPVIIYNPNYIGLVLSFPKVEIYYSRLSKLLGRSKPIGNTDFPKMQNTTVNFEMVLAQEINQTELARGLLADCDNPTLQQSLRIDLVSVVDVYIIVKNLNIPINSTFYLPCSPLSSSSSNSTASTLSPIPASNPNSPSFLASLLVTNPEKKKMLKKKSN